MTTGQTPEAPELEPAPPSHPPRWQRIAAIVAIVLAVAVPIAVAFGVDVCTPLDAAGVDLDACKSSPATRSDDAPSPGAPGDARPGGVLLHRHRDGGTR